MSIASEITRITGNIEDAYDILAEMGATIPANANSANLVAAIQTIPSGPVARPIYGVSGLAASSPALTRTDDAVGMSFVIDSSTGEITSDFNNAFPWNEAEIVTLAAGKFLRLPDMYFRVGVDDSSRITDIAVSKSPTDEGNWYKVDSFDVACYGGSISNNKLQSVSGVSRQASKTRAEFRAYASANGNDYFQFDLYHYTVLAFLWLIEWATKDSQSIMKGRYKESGSQGGTSARNTGGTDNIATPSGFESDYGQMRYHYIEDFVGNLAFHIDGVNLTLGTGTNNYYVTNDPSEFSDSYANYSAISYSVPNRDRCISSLGWDANNPFMCLPRTTANMQYNSNYYCDSLSSNAGNDLGICIEADIWLGNSSAPRGLFGFAPFTNSRSADYIGSRLLHTPS